MENVALLERFHVLRRDGALMTSPVSNTLSVETLLMRCALVSVDSVKFKEPSLMYSINVALLATVSQQVSASLTPPVSVRTDNAKDQMSALGSHVV